MAGPRKKGVLILVGILAGGVLLESYALLHFKRQRDGFLEQKRILEKKQTLLEKKYAEEKGRAGDLLRLKGSMESQIRALQSDLEKMQQERQILLSGTGGVGEGGVQMQQKIQALEARAKQLEQKLEQSDQEKKNLERNAAQAVQELNSKIAKLTDENQKLQDDWKREVEYRERCRADNARLAGLAEELMQKFKEKGVMDSLLQKEPFTQIKKVEVEELLQKYGEAKADHVLSPQEKERHP